MDYTAHEWNQVFKFECRQVEDVDVDSKTESLNIHFKGQHGTLQATAKELNEELRKFNSTPRDTVIKFLIKNGKIIFYKNTLVGYFDIQAYSTFIEINKTNFTKAVEKVNDLLAGIQYTARAKLGPLIINPWILSDSVILVIDTDICPLHSDSINFLFIGCSMIMKMAMEKGFPLRGAVGGGDFFKDGEIMVSSALVNAASYEKCQNWLGAVVTPEAYGLIENAMEHLTTYHGKTDKAFTWDYFNNRVRKGKIWWKNEGAWKNLKKDEVKYYIKPDKIGDNWTSYLPNYFKDGKKISNSNSLYAEE